jgi:hypothetical protein
MPNTYRIQVITKDITEVGEYCDAIYLDMPVDMTLEQFQKENESVIDDEKNRRIANWIDAVKNPPAPVEPTKEDLQAEEAAILEQKAMLDARVSEIALKVAEIDAKVVKDIKGK